MDQHQHRSSHSRHPSRLRRFNQRVAKVLPGWKTKITASLGSLGSIAAVLQQYAGGLPLDKLVTPTQVLLITTCLFSLAFWFKDIDKYHDNA